MLQLKSLHALPERRLAVHTAQPAYISCAAERRDLPAPLYAQVIEIPKQEARVKRISCADVSVTRTFSACHRRRQQHLCRRIS